MSTKTWVVVANGSKAEILDWPTPDALLQPRECLLNPENRTPDSAIDAHTPSHSIAGRPGLAPRHTPQENRREQFARRLARLLEQEGAQDHYDRLLVFASNPFLGELLGNLSPATRRRMAISEAIDVTALPVQELSGWVRKRAERRV